MASIIVPPALSKIVFSNENLNTWRPFTKNGIYSITDHPATMPEIL